MQVDAMLCATSGTSGTPLLATGVVPLGCVLKARPSLECRVLCNARHNRHCLYCNGSCSSCSSPLLPLNPLMDGRKRITLEANGEVPLDTRAWALR